MEAHSNRFRFALLFALAITLNACAVVDPEEQLRKQAAEKELKASRSKAQVAATRWLSEELSKFTGEATALAEEVILLRNHPGWPDIGQLIKALPSIAYVEGERAALLEMIVAQARGRLKWGSSWEDILAKYLALSVRSRTMEKRKVSLRSEWDRLFRRWYLVELEYLSYLIEKRQYDAARAQAEAWLPLLDALNTRTKSALNSFALDSLALYVKQPSLSEHE